MAIFIFGFIGFQSYEVKAELDYIETQTVYNEQLILDPSFNENEGSTPWNNNSEGDISDVDINIGGGSAIITVVGDQGTFSLVSNPPFSGWTATQNPNFPSFPDTYELNASGASVSHYWEEGADQSVAANWDRNVSLPVNMSDYVITSASLEATVNASVQATPSKDDNNGSGPVDQFTGAIDVMSDSNVDQNSTGGYFQGATGDYVRFYVWISDTEKNNVFEVAHNQTYNLGQDSPIISTMGDTLMVSIPEETLIFYLTSVLSHDYQNFTVTIGMRIWCEDNFAQDADNWELLIIKSVNLTFNYIKKIDQFNSISLTQTSNAILSSDYDVQNSTVLIGIDEATLNFKYKVDQNWSDYSPNSEFRIYVNNTKLSETLKLTEGNSTWQNATVGGFDVSSLVFIDNNISLSLEVYLADEFLLDENSTIWIDDVYLNVSFTVTVQTDKIETNLVTTGSLVRFVTWNESFQIEINYTDVSTGFGITGANFSVDWVDSNVTQEDGGGFYTITCNNTNTISGQTYFIDISVDDFGYLQNTLRVEVNVVERDTEIEIFMDGTNMTLPPVIELPITSILNVTAIYFDSSYSTPIENATFSLYGIEDSSFNYSEIGFTHQFLIDTEKLGLGPKVITLVAEKFNYKEISTLLRITIVPIQTNLTTVGNIQSATVTWDEQFSIDVNYVELVSGKKILNANFTANWIGGTYDIQELGLGIYRITCESNNTVSGLNYALEISVDDYLYEYNSLQVDVNVLDRETEIEIFMDEEDVSLSPVIELPITSLLNVTALFYDLNKSVLIQNATVSLYGILNTSYIYSQGGDGHQFIIDTLDLGLGTHLITIVMEKQNYEQFSDQLRITIVPIQTNLTTVGNIQSSVVTWDEQFFIDVNYVELVSGTDILNASFTANWIGGTYEIQELGLGIYRITCESNNTVSGLNFALEISVDDYLYSQNSLQVDVNVLDRETEIEIFMDEEDLSLSPVVELPITSLLNVTALFYDLNKSILINNATASLYGILEANYIYTQEGDSHQFIIDTLDIGLGTHLISLVLENQNFDQISTLLRITVVPIQINGTIRDDIQSVSITPGSDYLLEIQLRDEFGDLIQNIEVNYTWDGAPGTLTYNETSGYYTALLSDVPEGVFDIIITAEKGPNYDFEEYRITISSTTKLSVWQLVLIYFLAALIIALITGFGAYQLHYKYPPMVRDVRKLRRKLRKGRKTKSVLIDSREKIMDKIFQDKLRDSNIKYIKVKKIDKKVVRNDKDIKEITGEDLTKKPEKPVTDKKLPEKTKEKEKVEKLPDKKSEQEIAENEKKLKEKAEKEKIAKEKAAKKVAKKEQKLKEKTAEKEKSVMEKIAKEAAVKAKKIQEKPVKVGKKEEAKVKMSKISLPKKKDKKK